MFTTYHFFLTPDNIFARNFVHKHLDDQLWFIPRLNFRRVCIVQWSFRWNLQTKGWNSHIFKSYQFSYEMFKLVRISNNCMQFQIRSSEYACPNIVHSKQEPGAKFIRVEQSREVLLLNQIAVFRQRLAFFLKKFELVLTLRIWLCTLCNVGWQDTTICNDDKVSFIWKWPCCIEFSCLCSE